MQRRSYIGLLAGAGVASIAGCAGDPETDDAEGNVNNDGGDGNSGNSAGGNTDGESSDPTEEPTEAPTEEPTEAPTEAPTEESDGLEILEHEWYEDEFSGGVKGIVQNNTGEVLDYVAVEASFFDEEGVKLEDGLDNTTDLDAGTKWRFDAMYLGSDPSEVADYEIKVSDSPF